jgi:hypothetical protein
MLAGQSAGKGFRLPQIAATPSPAAAIVRAAAIQSTLSDFNLPDGARGFPDQGDVNCCVSCALAGAMEIIHPDWPELAPLFHYYVSRFMNNFVDSTGGLALDDALSTLTNQGICQHADHDVDHGNPYTPDESLIPPSAAAFTDALGRRIEFEGLLFKFKHVGGASWSAAIRDELRQMRPVAAGFRLPQDYPDGFLDPRFEWSDLIKAPASTAGHCVLVTGYSDSRQALRVRDSLGRTRFDNGGWWMGYRLADSGVIQDAYSLMP